MPEKAIQVVKGESKSGVIPSTQVIKMVLAKIKGSSSSFELIEKFRFSLPIETEAYELVCEAELQQKCQNVYKVWSKQKHEEAMIGILDIYKSIIDGEYQLNADLQVKFLQRVLVFIRLFIEELTIEAENLEKLPELDLIYHYGKLLIVTSDHYTLLALYWEIFFFDFSHFSSGQKAEELMQETPQLARHLNFSQLANRADKYDKVSIFRKLIEVSLQYDLSEEQKRLAFDGLLVFQCKYNFTTAVANIACFSGEINF